MEPHLSKILSAAPALDFYQNHSKSCQSVQLKRVKEQRYSTDAGIRTRKMFDSANKIEMLQEKAKGINNPSELGCRQDLMAQFFLFFFVFFPQLQLLGLKMRVFADGIQRSPLCQTQYFFQCGSEMCLLYCLLKFPSQIFFFWKNIAE